MTNKSYFGAVALLVVGLLLGGLFSGGKSVPVPNNDRDVGGVQYDVQKFVGDVYNGINDTLMMSAGVFVGPISVATGNTLTSAGLIKADGGVLQSYTNSTSTVTTTYTLAVADLLNYNSILLTPNKGALTLTFPASSTLSTLVPSAGDMQETCIFNATSTAAATITLASGTGISLERVATSTTSGSAGMLAIPANGSACFTFLRQKATDSSFDISVLVKNFISAE